MTADTIDRDAPPAISVLIPARNEAGALPALIAEIHAVLAATRHEIVVIDDGSDDDTAAVLARLAADDPVLVRLHHRQSQGKSAAMMSGAHAARGAILLMVDGDGQNDPRYLPALLAPLADPGMGLVAGQRTERNSTYAKKIASRIANRVRGALLADGTRDTACGLKAVRRELYLALPYFETMHRFLPALVLAEGWRIAHVDVVDRPRLHGVSKYGLFDRLAVGLPDLFGVAWLIRRRRRRPPILAAAPRNLSPINDPAATAPATTRAPEVPA